MDAFDYAALDGSGKRISGTVTAISAREARDILRAQKLTPLDLKHAKSATSSRLSFKRQVSHKALTQATRQLAILIGAATPVEEAIKITAMQFEKSPMRHVLLGVRGQVLEGARLSDALRSQAKTFSDLFIAMVASGEMSGRLPHVLSRLAVDMEASQKVRRKIVGATVYPIVLSIVALLVVTLLMVLVVPKVVAQFDSFGQELPGLTKAVIAISQGLQNYGLIALGVIILLIFGINAALRVPDLRYRWHKVFLRLPVMGKISRNLNAARFSRTMAGLIDSGTPALAAMETAKHTLRNDVMKQALSDAALKVREGASMSAALRKADVLPPLVVQMVAGGETSGDVGEMFSKSADYLEDEFDGATTIILNLLEPLIIIFLAGIVLLIIGAIFLPILRLNTLAF